MSPASDTMQGPDGVARSPSLALAVPLRVFKRSGASGVAASRAAYSAAYSSNTGAIFGRGLSYLGVLMGLILVGLRLPAWGRPTP